MLRSKSTSDSSLIRHPRPLSTFSASEDHSSITLPEDEPLLSLSQSDSQTGHFSSVSEISDTDDSVFAAVTDVQIDEFREVFRIFDSNQDGTITSTELIKILKYGNL